jgi:hypothetical protein
MKGLILTKNDTLNSHFNVDDLFRFRRMAFIVEIALAKAKKDGSKLQIKGKQDLFKALADKDTLFKFPLFPVRYDHIYAFIR